jgi:hypothetical protein
VLEAVTLEALARKHGTDKSAHGFCPFYDDALAGLRSDARTVLEIGVGYGGSLRMWREYFPNAIVHGLDCDAVAASDDPRIVIHRGDQADRRDLARLARDLGDECDLIVDDGGHTMRQQQVSLGVLFDRLRPGGVYVLEDLHTSFMTRIDLLPSLTSRGWSYETGAASTSWTTYDIVCAIAEGRDWSSDHMTAAERRRLVGQVERVSIFDRDGDRRHVTSLLWKTGAPRLGPPR